MNNKNGLKHDFSVILQNIYLHIPTKDFLVAKEGIPGGIRVQLYNITGEPVGTKDFSYEELLASKDISKLNILDVRNVPLASELGKIILERMKLFLAVYDL